MKCKVPLEVDLLNKFYTLDHSILLHKYHHFDIRGVAKQLFESNIANRQ